MREPVAIQWSAESAVAIPVLGILSARTLVIVVVLATMGLVRGHQASAQEEGSGFVDIIEETVWEATLGDHEISAACSRYSNNISSFAMCWNNYQKLRANALAALQSGSGGSKSQALPSRLADRSRVEASGSSTFAPTLESSVSTLPFLGNWLTVLNWVPNAATEADATVAYAVGLARQSDCSLDEVYVLPGAGLPAAEYFTSLTQAQDYFHQIAGLTTTPDVFANGCTPQVLGLPATGIGLSLGFTSDGAAIGAELAGNGLYVTVTDLTANTVTNTQLSNSQNAGYFSAASLRNNGIFDIVETSLTDPVTQKLATAVFLGNGDGTFKSPVYYDVSDNGLGQFTIDDVNGDGIPDIVELTGISITNPGARTFTGTVTTLIGKGDGTFTLGPASAATGFADVQPFTGVFKSGDVKDLLIGGTVLFGAGNGSFTQGPTNAAIASATNYLFPGAVGSLRNNGILDVVISQPGFVSIFLGNGDGTFATGPSYAALPDYMQVTITDIDGDGNPDIVLGTSTGGVYNTPLPMFQILMNRGGGTFVDSPVYDQGTYGIQADASNSELEIASADFNGDGNLDVLAFNRNNNGGLPSSLLMLPGDGKGNLGAAVTSSINITPYFIVAAKMYHDTMPDAVIVGEGTSPFGPQLSVLINQGNGTFAGEQDYPLPDGPVSLAVGDFNGDGIPDVAVGVVGGVYVLLGQANGKLGAPVRIDSSMNPTGLAAGSLTSDGRTDLVVADQGYFSFVGGNLQVNGALHVYLGNANGTFTTVTAPTTTATNYTVAALGDLNNDGKLDLIAAGNVAGTSPGTGTPNVYTLLGNGDGTFKAANTLALAGQDGIGATSIALADFNKDGKLDAVVGNPNDFTEVLFGNGDGTLADALPALGQQPATVAAADLLGNGYPEILVGESGTQGQGNSLTVLLNMATAWTAAAATTPTVTVSPSPSSITTAQSTMVTVTVSGASGAATPTGSVTLSGGGYTSPATTLISGSTVITIPAGALALGADLLTAVYTPDAASTSVYNSGTGSNSVTVTAAPAPTFSLSNNGPITIEASATTGNTAIITATPSNGFTGAINLTCAATTSLANPVSPATCAVTPSVTIAGASAQTATLTVTTTQTTTAGAYAVTVTGISGAITMQTTVNVTVSAYVAPNFMLTPSGAVTIGSPGSTTGNTEIITVTPSGGFTGNVTLTAALTASPTGAIDPPSASLGATSPVGITGASAGTGTLTVTTTSGATAGLTRPNMRGAPWYTAGGATLACLLLVAIPPRRRRWRTMLGMLVLLAAFAAGVSACAKKQSLPTGTTQGTYTFTVTGTSGSITQTTTVTVNVD